MTTTNTLNHKDTTKHIRSRIKHYGIKASVRMYVSCGTRYISVNTNTYEGIFTKIEWSNIALICKTNKLTGARGSDIDVDAFMQKGQDFEFHG